jgi:septal ring factor EnvC (AmiA/AmiB activator)
MYTKKSKAELNGLKKEDLITLILVAQDELEKTSDEKVTELKKELESKDEVLAQTKEQLEQKDQTIQDLNDELAKAETSSLSSSDNVVSIDGKKYRMLAKTASFNDMTITAKSIEADPELGKQLVELGVGYLQLIGE